MTDAELDAIRAGLQPIRAHIESPSSEELDLAPLAKLVAASIYAHTLLREVDRLRAEVDRDHAALHGIGCWLSEALGDTPDGAEPTAESLRLSAETLAKRITALANHLEGRPSDLDLGVYDSAGGSFGRLLVAARALQAELDNQRRHGKSPAQALTELRAERDRLAAYVTEIEAVVWHHCRDGAELDSAIRAASRPVLGAWVDGDSAGVPGLADVVDRLAARVAELEGRPSVPPPSLNTE